MKRFIPHLLFVLFIGGCLAGCTKTTPPVNVITPSFKGNYSGTFVRVHENLTTFKLDTLSATITVKLDSLGAYTVGGDTTTVHAGSFGTYALGYNDDIVFVDKTLPKTGTPVKSHLSGDYLYSYDGTTLQLQKVIGDSIKYSYVIHK